MKLSGILKVAGIALGAIMALTLVSLYPIKILLIGVGALLWTVGAYLKKKGQ